MIKKLLLIIICMTLFCSIVYADIDDPTVYWSFDTDSSDDWGSSDLNLGAGALEPTHLDSTCLIGGCYDFETTASASGQELYLTNTEQGALPKGSTDFSFSGWVNFESTNVGGNWWYLIHMGEGCTSKGVHLITKPSTNRAWFETGCADFDTGDDLATGTWIHYAFSFEHLNNTMAIFLNGVYQGTLLTNIAMGLTTNDLSIGNAYNDASGSGLDGKLDEYAFYNHTLTGSDNCEGNPDNDICNLYNNGSGYNPISAPSIAIPDINITDADGNFIDGEVSELSFWELSVNATLDGVTEGGFECNWSGGQLTKVIFDLDANNYSIDQTTTYTQQFNVSSDNVVGDIFGFDVCRVSGVSRDVLLSVNNESDYLTIDDTLIPLCSTGTHSELNSSVLPITDQINITISCVACTGGNELRIVPVAGGLFRMFRVDLPHFSELVFNSSTGRYNDDFEGETFHRHAFEEGLNEINVTCNGTTQSKTFNVASVSPNASLVQINAVPFVNGTFIESGNVSIIGECSGSGPGSFIESRNITVTYSNGTLVREEQGDVISLQSSELASDDNYTVSLFCVSELGNVSTDNKFFELRDTTNPSITIINPSGDAIINTQAQVQVLYQDQNLFGYNLTIDCSVQGLVFSEHQVNLSGISYFVDNQTINLTVEQSCILSTEACDDHTIKEFKFDSVSTDRDSKNVTLDGKVIIADYSSYDVKDIDFIQKTDRLSYCYEYDTFGDIDKLKTYKYRISKLENWELRDQQTGHFASWDTRQWVDFVPELGYDFDIERVTEDSEFYYVEARSWDNRVCFESIGGLNCATQTFNFSVTTPSTAEDGDTSIPDLTTGQTLFLIMLILLYIALLHIGFTRGIFVLILMGFVLGMGIGIILLSEQPLIATLILLINAVACFAAAYIANN